DRLEAVVQQNRGVAVEPDRRAVRTPQALLRAHDDRVVDLALLHTAARNRILDRDLDHVADARIAALRAAEHLDAHQAPGARVVGRVQYRFRLNHRSIPSLAVSSAGAASLGGSSTVCALPTISTTRHDLRFESGRHSLIATVSPVRHALSSSWAMIFVVRRMYLPYIGWRTSRSTATVTLLSILSLITRPTTLRAVLPPAPVVSLPVFSAALMPSHPSAAPAPRAPS